MKFFFSHRASMRRKLPLVVLALVLIMATSAAPLSGCKLIKEGVTGEKQDEAAVGGEEETAVPEVAAAFNIIGDWYGVYGVSEYVAFRFTADGKCELQPAIYMSDVFGPRYYGDYRWGGDDGQDVILDMYKGVSKEVDYGGGNIWDEWSDGGREGATTALSITFGVYGSSMKTFALKAAASGVDTDGYTVVQAGAFLVLFPDGASGGGNMSQFVFGAGPFDQTEGKILKPVAPDNFLPGRTDRFFTTAELNVRCGPGTDYGTYGTVPPGTPVDKIGEALGKNDWAFVLLQGGGGWCNTDYLSVSPPPKEPTDQEDQAE